MADQFRADCIGYDGNKFIMSPHLDDLAADGCYFQRGYSPSPTCVPARACLVTGKKASKTGFFSNDFSVPWTYGNTLMQVLQTNGYQTINVGKNHFKPQRIKLGFEVNLIYETKNDENGTPSDYHLWLQKQDATVQDTSKKYDNNGWPVYPWTGKPELHPTEWTATAAIEQLELRDPTRPFYMQMSFHRPHPPLDPPKYILDYYQDIELPGPSVGDWAPQFDNETTCLFPFEGLINPRCMSLAKKAYYASITHIDSQIGRMINYLKKEKLYDKTTVIFISDHGEMMGDHNMFRKGPAMEGSARIPYIVKFANGICDEYSHKRYSIPVSLLDIMPTCLDISNVEIPTGLDGESLKVLLLNPEKRQYVFGENYRSNKLITTGGAFVVGDRYKYVWNSWLGEEYLFDLEKDPNELNNLAKNENCKEILKEMSNVVKAEYATRPYDDMIDSEGNLKARKVLPAYRKPV